MFIFIAHDGPQGLERRQAHRDQHRAYLESLDRDGRLVYGGPLRDESDRSIGAVLVLDVPDLATARATIEQDPYVRGGVFERFELHRFVRAFPR